MKHEITCCTDRYITDPIRMAQQLQPYRWRMLAPTSWAVLGSSLAPLGAVAVLERICTFFKAHDES